ncbi:hypothetical protein Hypma_011674 [Hypsizygus marmoreus]|uniref:Condensation domain-containing protein n=1 Tax=Hypsizygus marmoreus TaxID=39966 RepID=A0A369JP15_HYPMA|nr:hypothetical protein Hypma_011674 [Hypsizygus marmoreus]
MNSPWTLQSNVPTRIYERPLGLTELGFYWDCQFNGTADTLQHAIVEVLDSKHQHLFSIENVTRTWVALKQRFPLLGSRLAERRKGGDMVFVIAEDRLGYCGPGEMSMQDASSLAEAEALADSAVNGERLLSNELLARIVILRRTDQINQVHVLIHVAHCITDGIANASILRCFLDMLSSENGPGKWDLEERLALAASSEDLAPGRQLNQARHRWQYAIGKTIASNRLARLKGGHSLPRRFTQLTPFRPARSAHTTTSFSTEESKRIIQTCRAYGMTFGVALPVLAQVALTRVLCRRYLSGDIDKNEWEYRRKEPMTTGGPLNLRPFLDRSWYERGGIGDVSLKIGFFFRTLPFMPLGSASKLAPGDTLPDVQDMLSLPRFLLRCRSVQQQANRLVNHPLFLHISTARSQASISRLKVVVSQWKNKLEQAADHDIPVPDQGLVLSHGGSSMGNLDHLIPLDYPLSRTPGTAPILHLLKSGTQLHCRPGELYLGASTTRQQLHLFIHWDKNVYDEETVKEWLQEVRSATECYLGGLEHVNTRGKARL